MTASSGFKLDPPHSSDCYLAAQGRQEFIVGEGHVWRDKRGTNRHMTHMWHVFRCNCKDCPARVLVRDDVLMDFIAEHLPVPGTPPEEGES